MKEVREVPKSEWDNLVKESEQGTIFCTTKWFDLYQESYRLYGLYNNTTLLGGLGGFGVREFDSGTLPLCPFQGVLIAPQNTPKYTTLMSMHHEVAEALIEDLGAWYGHYRISNHYTFPDVRPFLWKGWESSVKYTYIVDTSDLSEMWERLEKQTRYEVRQRTSMSQWSLSHFDKLYEETFKRKGLERPISSEFLKRLNDSFDCKIVGNGSSMAYVIWDEKRAYYILGASDGTGSAQTVWAMLDGVHGMGINELDMVGANDKSINLFKAGFGGRLSPYYKVSV